MAGTLMMKITHVVAGALAVGTIMAGLVKLAPQFSSTSYAQQVHAFDVYYHPQWAFLGLSSSHLRSAVGAAECVSGLASLAKRTRLVSYLVMTAIYAGAVRTHLVLGDNGWHPAAGFLLASCFCLGQTVRVVPLSAQSDKRA
eukprot:TRINITY_DN1726_c0_g1_i1.p2 TRINITY_DN1726_c0_g1~~TRINITY_DN1726_c0_g1_i1.p2  ORF type:complete len:142 (+),score=31.96 TRINITY_DN1726_c0_g1_i1:127-552(+)